MSTPERATPREAAPVAPLRCPHCGAEDVRKASLMYEQSTSNLNFRSLSMNDEGGASYTAGAGGVQNLMGGRVAPPAQPTRPVQPGFPVFSVLLLALMALATAHAIMAAPGTFFSAGQHPTSSEIAQGLLSIFVLFGIPLLRLVHYATAVHRYRHASAHYDKQARPDYENRLKAWNRSWMCMRCGDPFERS